MLGVLVPPSTTPAPPLNYRSWVGSSPSRINKQFTYLLFTRQYNQPTNSLDSHHNSLKQRYLSPTSPTILSLFQKIWRWSDNKQATILHHIALRFSGVLDIYIHHEPWEIPWGCPQWWWRGSNWYHWAAKWISHQSKITFLNFFHVSFLFYILETKKNILRNNHFPCAFF